MIYVDTSAFMKLVRTEAESEALRSYVKADEFGLVSSALLAVEARRAAQRLPSPAVPRVDLALSGVRLVQIGAAVIESAGRLPADGLPSLDAIHLATLLLIRPDVDRLLCYDQRLTAAAQTHGVPVVAPS